MITKNLEEFEEMVLEALEGLSSNTKNKLKNIAICVDERPTAHQLKGSGMRKGYILLGLYEGVPQTQWGKGFGGNLPDKITIFRESLEQIAKDEQDLKEQVRETVRHEIAHYFGYSDEDIKSMVDKD